MSAQLHLRAIPSPALRNSAAWLERQFEDDVEAHRGRSGRHCEEVLDERYADQAHIYAGACRPHAEDRPQAQVVLGGRPVRRPDPDQPPFLVLTAAQARRVAVFLTTADFDTLWFLARGALLPRYGGLSGEPEARRAFAAGHRELTAFYVRTAECGEAVVKRLSSGDGRFARLMPG
ncbi:DUF1877 family protein [Streptomyces sp. NPDC046759]|uniref:DUF1877 family protein n=1 Tax=Streptomyces sp. NPDC046759 TaxID=3155019 RepID=UPI0033C2CEB7